MFFAGINIFLEGFIRTENLRFRDVALTFKVVENASEEEVKRLSTHYYPAMKKQLGSFHLSVDEGSFTESEIVVLLGENGTGKTTLIRILAGNLEPDEGVEVPQLNISYKPQKISPKFTGTVRDLLNQKIRESIFHPQFQTDVSRPLQIDNIIDQEVQNLSGGELQRVALCLCLGKPADVYLIDEPSAYLDSEQRLHAARVIKRLEINGKIPMQRSCVSLFFSIDLFFIVRKQVSLLSTISSWQLIWLIVSLFSTVNHRLILMPLSTSISISFFFDYAFLHFL